MRVMTARAVSMAFSSCVGFKVAGDVTVITELDVGAE